MATKVKTQTPPTSTTTNTTTVQTQPQWWASSPFDQQTTTTEESFSASISSVGAASPPPNIQLKNAQNNYSFGDIAISHFTPATVQTKLVVGAPDDKYEQEADAMADKVMSMGQSSVQTAPEDDPIQRDHEDEGITLKPLVDGIQRDYEDEGITLKPLADGIQRDYEDEGITLKPLADGIQRDYEDEGITLKPLADGIQRDYEDEGITLKPLTDGIQRDYEDEGITLKPLAKDITDYQKPSVKKINRDVNLSPKDGAFQADSGVESSLKASKGGGKPLPDRTRNFMESRFGNDFSQVKVHNDSKSAQMNKNLQAKAFTHGNDIYFNSGHYNPESKSGKSLIAHELTHTIQQTGASPLQTKQLDDRSAKNNKQNEPELKRKKLPTYLLAENIQKEADEQKISTESLLAQEISSVSSEKTVQRDKDSKKKKLKKKIDEAKEKVDESLEEQKEENPDMDFTEAKKRTESIKGVGDKLKQKTDTSTDEDSVDDVEDSIEDEVNTVDTQELENTKKEEEKNEQTSEDDNSEDKEEGGEGQDQTTEETVSEETGGEEEGTGEKPPEEELDLETDGGTEGTTEGNIPQTTVSDVGSKSPKTPQDDPAFQSAIETTQGMTEQQKTHQTSEDASKDAQNASEDPGQQMRIAQSDQSNEAAGKEPGIFDREAFISALMAVLEKNAPQSQSDVDSGKGAGTEVTNTLKSEVDKEKTNTGGDFQETAQSDPDPTTKESKEVTDLPDTTEVIGETPEVEGVIDPLAATPKNKSEEELETPSQEIVESLDNLVPDKAEPIQTKMMVGAPDDQYEQEADRMADQVMAMSDNSVALQTTTETTQNNKIQNAKISGNEAETVASKDLQTASEQESFAQSIQTSPENILQRDELTSDEFTQDINQDKNEVPLDQNRLKMYGKEAGVDGVGAIEEAKKGVGEEGPQEFRSEEQSEIDKTQQLQLANILTATQEKQDIRTDEIENVSATQSEAKTEDEVKRDEINQVVQGIYDETKTNVNVILDRMDQRVNQEFARTNRYARNVFEQTQRREFKKWKNWYYKDQKGIKIPIGLKGWKPKIKWAKIFNGPLWLINKVFTGLPDSVNKIYEVAKQKFLDAQKEGVYRIADIVEEEMLNAKAEVDRGRERVAEYVSSLPDDLKEIGAGAAANIQAQFDSLEQGIQDRQNQLVDELTTKYEESIKEIDDRIEKLKEANKGLINKVLDVLAAIAKWILKFIAKLLKPVLSKIPFVGPVVNPLLDAIIDDPGAVIGAFIGGVGDGLKNFVNNIAKHLKNGLFEWLFGVGLPIVLPKKFDGPGILSILLQLFGLTTDYILDLAGDFFPLPIVDLVRLIIEKGASVFADIENTLREIGVPELGVKFFVIMKDILVKGAEGFLGFLDLAKEGLNALKEGFMEIIMFKVAIPLLIQKGIEYLLKMTNPAGGVVAIVEGLVKLVIFFINNKDKIAELLNTLGEAVVAMIQKSRPLIASIMELGLAQMIPLLLSFLASLLGLDAIPKLIAKALKAMLAPVTKLFSFIFEKISAVFKGIKDKLGFGDNGEDDAKKRAEKAAEEVEDTGRDKRDPDSVKGELAGIEKRFDFTGRSDKKDKKFTFKPPGKMFWNNERYYVKGETTQIEQDKESSSSSSSSKKTSTAKRKPLHASNHTPEIQPQIQREIDVSQGRGQPLTPALQMSMGQAFKHDFSGVKIHNNTQGDRLSRSLDAQAFTVGKDIYFRQGSYQPNTIQGKRLLAHELTHVVQNSNESSPQLVQRKIDWKDKKKALKVEEKVSGSKKKAKFEIKFLLINQGDILPKVKKDMTKIINKYKSYSKVVGKLYPLKKKYNLKDIDTKRINQSQYTITAELPPSDSSSGQRKAVNSSVPDVVGANLEHVIQRTSGQGSQIKPTTRSSMESAFGYDFSGVKVHTNEEADIINRSVNAKAFTTGRDIYFRQGAYQPDTIQGKHLLAHELTHVVQQSGGQVQMSLEADRGTVGGINSNKYASAESHSDVVQRQPLPNGTMNLIQRAELATAGRKAGEATARYFFGPENVDIKSNPRSPKGKSKMTLKVTIKKEKSKAKSLGLEGAEDEENVTPEAIPSDVLSDITVALRVIVNQNPDPDIVEAKLEDVKRFYDLRLLSLTGVGFTGDNIEFNVMARGKATDKEPGNVFKLLFDIKKKYAQKEKAEKESQAQTKPIQTKPLDNASQANNLINRKEETSSNQIQRGPLANLGKQLGAAAGQSLTSSSKDKSKDKSLGKDDVESTDEKKLQDQVEGDTSEMDEDELDQLEGSSEGQTEEGKTTSPTEKAEKEKKKSKKKRKARIVGFDVGVKVIPTSDPSTVNMKVKANAKKK